VAIFKYKKIKELSYRKRKTPLEASKGFRYFLFDAKGKPAKFSSRKKLYGYLFKFSVTKQGHEILSTRGRQQAADRKQKATAKRIEKETRKEIPVERRRGRWIELSPYVRAFLDQYDVPRTAWEESVQNTPFQFAGQVAYPKYQFFFDEPIDEDEIGHGEISKSLTGTQLYIWVIAQVPRSLKQYVTRGRIYLPRGEDMEKSYKDKTYFYALMGLPVTWKPVLGIRKGKHGRRRKQPVLTIPQAHAFLLSKNQKTRRTIWQETVEFYSEYVHANVAPVQFVGFTMDTLGLHGEIIQNPIRRKK